MVNRPMKTIASVFSLVVLCHTSVLASSYDRVVTAEDLEGERIYSPSAGRNYPDEVLFGDTHFHTNLSFDAGLVGTTLGVDEGFRYARGENYFGKYKSAEPGPDRHDTEVVPAQDHV